MSGKLLGWAMKQVTGSPVTKLVLVKLADNANENGFCCASLELIVEHTELSDRAVRKHLYELENLKLITIERRKVDGVQLRNLYHLNVSDDGDARRATVWHEVPPVVLHEVQDGQARDATRVLHDVPAKKDNPQVEPSRQPSSRAAARADGEGEISRASEGKKQPKDKPRHSDGFDRFWVEVRKWPEFSTIWSKPSAWEVWTVLDGLGDLLKPGDMVAAAREYGRERVRLNAEARADRKSPQHTKHPANWLREKAFIGIHEALIDAGRGSAPSANVTLKPEHVEKLRAAGLSDDVIAAWFAGCEVDEGPPPTLYAPKKFQAEHIAQRFAGYLERAFGAAVIVTVKQERAA